MNEPIEIKKSEMESYVIQWDSHKNYMFLALKVFQVFRKKGGKIEKKYKNMVTYPGIDQTLPDVLQKRQLREAMRVADEIAKAVKRLLHDMPKKKVEF